MFCFFFSSRRRHTRCGRDWSSDVCSSDLRHQTFIKASFSRRSCSFRLEKEAFMKVWCRVLRVLVAVIAMGVGSAWAQGAKHKPVTVTGRVVDNICMLGMGLKGEGHRECAVGCDKAGVRMALLDEKANVLYTLMADKPFADPNSQIREHLERMVTIKGDLYEAPGGQKVLAIKEVQVAQAGATNACAAQDPCAGKNPSGAKK